MTGREVILGRVRAALAGATPPVVDRGYARPAPDAGSTSVLDLFVTRLQGYHATVHRVRPQQAADTIAGILRDRGQRRVIAPPGLNDAWLAADGVTWVGDEPALSSDEVAAADAVVTAAAVAIADSGTIVLDGSAGQGRRVLSLLPDAMIVVLEAAQVVSSLPAAIARLDGTRPMTFVSGPSATVDIELVRVQGVHGPRALDVVLLDPHGAFRA